MFNVNTGSRMLDNFLDSVDVFSSDDEIVEQPDFHVKVSISTDRLFAETTVVAARPSSITFSYLFDSDEGIPIICNATKAVIGRVVLFRGIAFVSVNRQQTRFNVSDIVETSRIIVLHSQQSRSNSIIMFTSSSLSPGNRPIPTFGGLAADQYTQCLIRGLECTVIINEHTSIQADLDGIMSQWHALSKLVPEIADYSEDRVKQEFKRVFPINKKVPLYT